MAQLNLSKRVFLTGATGLLGRQLVKQLIENQYEISALIRPGNEKRIEAVPHHLQIKWIEGDLGSLHALEEGMADADFVIHAAALVSFDPSDRNRLTKVNAEGTENVVNVALKMPGLKKMVHVSSVATFSPSKPMPADINERQGFNPDDDTSDYAHSKYQAELEIFRGVEEGLKAVMVNPSIVLSPGGEDESSASLLDYARKKHPFYPSGWINYVDARDVASVIVQLLHAGPEDGRKIILSAGTLPYKDFFHQLSRGLGWEGPKWEATPALTSIAWRLDAIRSLFTSKKRFLTRFTAASSAKRFKFVGIQLPKVFPDFNYQKLELSIKWMISETK